MARAEGKNLLNGIGRGHVFAVEMSIKYHEIELAKLRAKLNALKLEKE